MLLLTRVCGTLLLAGAVVCLAASPVATVRSSAPFALSGATVPVAGASAWPVAAGDEIAAGEAPVVLTFKDGSKVTLAKSAKAKIELKGEETWLRLLAGKGSYNLATGSRLRLEAGRSAGTQLVNKAGAAVVAAPRAEIVLPPPVSRQ